MLNIKQPIGGIICQTIQDNLIFYCTVPSHFHFFRSAFPPKFRGEGVPLGLLSFQTPISDKRKVFVVPDFQTRPFSRSINDRKKQ